MGIVLPQTLEEWLPLLVPLATLAIALVYFLAPRRAMESIGLVARPGRPEAIGEARSRFAGFPAGIATACILFGQPILLTVLGLAWAVAAFGKLSQFVFDEARSPWAIARLALASVLAVGALLQAPPQMPEYVLPGTAGGWIVAVIAFIAALFGLICLLLPRYALMLVRLAPMHPAAAGELQGIVAGFHLATGFCVLAYGGVFLQLALAFAFAATAFGRLISILSDRAANSYNWTFLLAEILFAALPMMVVFGMIA